MSKTCYEKMVENIDLQKGNIVHLLGKVSYKKFLHDVDAFAFSLTEKGFVRGDVLTLYLPSCPQALVAFYACSKTGVVANIVHPLTPVELLKINLQKTKSKGIVFYDVLVKNQQEMCNLGQFAVRASATDYTTHKLACRLRLAFTTRRAKDVCDFSAMVNNNGNAEVTAKGDDTVCTMHSGGTSGNPKIIRLSNENFNAQAESIQQMYAPSGVTADQYSLVTLPIFHAYGLGVSVHTCLAMGYSLCLVPHFSVKALLRAVKRHNVTYMAVVPVMLKKLMAKKHVNFKPFRSVKVIWCGGDAVSERLIASVNDALHSVGSSGCVMRGYGLTEITGVCSVNNFENYRSGSCGKALPNVNIEVWNELGECMPPNTIGDIMLSGPMVMQGYLTAESDQNAGGEVEQTQPSDIDYSVYARDMGILPEELASPQKNSEKSKQQNGIIERDGKRYVETGDIGYVDQDGYLFLLDRKKRSFKISAVNVFPAEIEQLVTENIDYVCEACAVDVTVNGKRLIKVYITVSDNSVAQQQVKQDVIGLCQSKLMKYSVPSLVEIIDKMPHTNVGKIDYRRLQSLNKN